MKSISRRQFGIGAAALSVMGSPRILRADQPLKMIVVVPPGASMDSIVRIVADKLPAIMGRSVIVEYHVGGTGLTAGAFMKSTSPDGEHIMFAPISTVAFFPFLYSTLPYDPDRDLTPVCEGAISPNALCISKEVGAANLGEFVELVRKNPLLGSVGTSSLGSVGAFLVHQMGKISGADLRLVAYRGGQPLLTDLMGNHIPAGQSVLSDYLESHRSGLVKILGVTTEKRTVLAPDLPTFKEQGFAELHGQTTMGFFVRGGTPSDLVARHADAINQALAMADVKQSLAGLGLEATGSSPQRFAETIASERKRWEPVARDAGIKLN
jgi:tripartite-type tricarboxylate transporter receptor subunit TctC